jgi:hypothetical protein
MQTTISNKNRFDVNNYSISELTKMIGIKTELSETNINSRCSHLISSFSKSKNNNNTNVYTDFINNIKKHLIDYIQHKTLGYNSTLESMYNDEDSKNMKIALKNNISNAPIVAYSAKFPKSVINPVYKETVTQLVSIDSIFRERINDTSNISFYNTSSNFQYKFANPVKNVVSMKISTVELPIAWYLFNEDNNTFTIETSDLSGTIFTSHTITIPIGTYDSDNLVSIINNIFLNTGGGLEYILFGIDGNTGNSFFRAKNLAYDGAIIGVNDPYSINPSANFIFNINFYMTGHYTTTNNCKNKNKCEKSEKKCETYFYTNNKSCERKTLKEYDSLGWILGFRNASYSATPSDTLIDNYSGSSTYTFKNYISSEGIFGTSAPSYIYIDIDDFNNNFKSSGIISDNNNYVSSNTILGRINIPNPTNTSLLYNSSDNVYKTREYFGPTSINRLNLKLVDKFGNIVNLHNNDWSVALEFTILYQ